MRAGAPLSAAAHAGLIGLALWGLPWLRVRPEPPVEAVQVSLVSAAQLAALSRPAPPVPPAAPATPPPAAAPAAPVALPPEPLPEDLIPPEELQPDLAPAFDAAAPLGIADASVPDATAPAFDPALPVDRAASPARGAARQPSIFGLAPLAVPSPFSAPAAQSMPIEIIVQPDPAAPEAAPPPTQLARTTPPPPRPLAAVDPPAADEPLPGAAAGPASAGASAASAGAASSDPAAAERASFQAAVRAAIEAARFYPKAARDRGLAGAARLEVSIARDGRLLQARLLGSSGSPLLDRAALAAARQARLPAAPAGLPGESFRFEVGVQYRLSGG